ADAFEHAVDAGKRGFAYRNDRHVADRVDASLHQVGDEHVRHEIDGGSRVAEPVEQLQDSRLRGHGQGNIDCLNPMLFDVVWQVVDGAEQRVVGKPADAFAYAVIEKSVQAYRAERAVLDLAGERQAVFVHACNNCPACLALGKRWRKSAQGDMYAILADGSQPQPD